MDDKTSIFIFRRDLRLDDNTGLIKALNLSGKVIPLFILTPTQVSDINKFKSSNSIQFMIESLIDLDQQIKDVNKSCKLWVMYGDEIDCIDKICSKINIDSIYVNEDYTPYSITRDNRIKKYCKKNNIILDSSTDILLLDTQDIAANNGNRYHIFTQFYNKTKDMPIRKPNYDVGGNFMKLDKKFKNNNIKVMQEFLLGENFYEINEKIAINGGRSEGLESLNKLKKFKSYAKTRNTMSLETTKLSAHNKFGTISVREAYYAMMSKAKSIDMAKQLYWRDFYYYISTYFDTLYQYDHIYKKSKKGSAQWENDKKLLKAWKSANTGYPIVDAAMTELNETGFMHNRGRMIVASFLTKDLLIDWKYGEQYFATKLVDIDRAQNIGNWNWSASFGMDSTTFLRIFNPWTQSGEYDCDAEYIKKWLPKLSDIPAKHLHQWDKFHSEHPNVDYPKPIVDHSIRRKMFIDLYKKYFG